MRDLTCDPAWTVALRGHLAQRPSPVPPPSGPLPRTGFGTTLFLVSAPVCAALWSLLFLGHGG